MKKNFRVITENTCSSKQDSKQIKASVARIENEMASFNQGMLRLTNFVEVNYYNKKYLKYNYFKTLFFQMKSVNIYDYFPMKDAETMNKYLKKDSEYEERKEQLSTILLMTVAPTKKKFANAVITKIFTKEYISKFRWPSVRY